MKYKETILEGIERAPDALIGLFTRLNTGEMLVQLADDVQIPPGHTIGGQQQLGLGVFHLLVW